MTETRTTRGRDRSVELLPTTKKNSSNKAGVGRRAKVEVTEMIKGFLFCFKMFH